MADMLWRLLWFFIVAGAVAYMVFIVCGTTIQARALDASRIVVVRDVLQPGTHYLSGMVMVQSTCAHLSVDTQQLSLSDYQLHFRTWEEPSVTCAKEDTPRAFRTVVFAPAAGVNFSATLDDTPLQIAVIPAIQKENIQ